MPVSVSVAGELERGAVVEEVRGAKIAVINGLFPCLGIGHWSASFVDLDKTD
jgi:hypothetical protein